MGPAEGVPESCRGKCLSLALEGRTHLLENKSWKEEALVWLASS